MGGRSVAITGLTTREDLNGRIGRLVKLDEERDRWTINLPKDGDADAMTLHLRPQNLILHVVERAKPSAKAAGRKRKAPEMDGDAEDNNKPPEEDEAEGNEENEASDAGCEDAGAEGEGEEEEDNEDAEEEEEEQGEDED